MRLLEEALEATPAEEPGTRARLRARLAVENYYADPAGAESLSEQAVSDARASGDPGALAAALNARRVALWRPAHARSRLDVVDEMIVAAEAAGDRESVLQARNWRVVDLLELGRMDELRREIDGYERLADEVGLPHYRWYVPLWRATLAFLAGRWDEGSALTAQAEALGRRAADPNAPLHAGVQHQFSLGARFRVTDVDREWSLQKAGSAPMPEPWLAAVAHVDARSGRRDSARELLERLTAAGVVMDVNWLQACLLADAAADVGDPTAAAYLHDRLEPYADQFAVVARGAGCYCSTELLPGPPGGHPRPSRRGGGAPAPRRGREREGREPDVRRDLDAAARRRARRARRRVRRARRAHRDRRPGGGRSPCRRWRPEPPPRSSPDGRGTVAGRQPGRCADGRAGACGIPDQENTRGHPVRRYPPSRRRARRAPGR